jgi:hypothetical protein
MNAFYVKYLHKGDPEAFHSFSQSCQENSGIQP